MLDINYLQIFHSSATIFIVSILTIDFELEFLVLIPTIHNLKLKNFMVLNSRMYCCERWMLWWMFPNIFNLP